MYNSKNKLVFDLIVEKLNENTQGVTFGGNFMFQFNQPGQQKNFKIYTLDGLEYKENEIVPVVDVQSIQIPFVENNERNDWEREFYVAIEIQESKTTVTNQTTFEFDYTNVRYQAILETLDNLQSNLTFVDGDYKYSFKVKEPTKVSNFTYNGRYYQVLAITMNLTSIKSGFFGNETKLYFGELTDASFGETADYELDVMEFSEAVAKSTRANTNSNVDDEAKAATKRTWTPTITVNFNGTKADLLLYKEKSAVADLNNKYQLKVSNNNLNTFTSENYDYTYTVIVTSIGATYKNNKVDQLTFTLERA